jgi:hypothetical protein
MAVGVSYLVLTLLELKFIRRVLDASWLLFGCLLIFVWLFNTEQPWQHKLLGLVVICLLCFLLEGVELAFTELHDKDSERLPDNIKGVVAEVNRRRAEFYDARELLVVILLVSITILSDNTKISLPIIGPTSDRRWTLGFSLVFTSLIVIWLAQGPSKMLATTNSAAFLRFCEFPSLWRLLIKPLAWTMSKLRLNSPSELIVGRILAVSKPDGTSAERNLPPSRHSFYLDALKCYGYSYHFADDVVAVSGDGSVFEHRCLLYVTKSGERSSFSLKYDFDGPILDVQEEAVDVYSVPMFGETMSDEYHENLRAVFEQTRQPAGFVKHEFVLRTRSELSEDKHEVVYSVQCPEPVPGCLVVNGLPASAAAIRVHVKVVLGPGAFRLPADEDTVTDNWGRRIAVPCGEYRFRLEVTGGVELEIAQFRGTVNFWNEIHPGETSRLGRPAETVAPNMREKLIFYPLTGADYRFDWEIWRR